MNCFYTTKDDKVTWKPGEIVNCLAIGSAPFAVVMPAGATKLILVEFERLEVGSENPLDRIAKAEADKVKAQQEADAKQAAINAKEAAKAKFKAEAMAKAEADLDAKAEAEAAKTVAAKGAA